MQFVLGQCGVTRNEACDAKSEKASDLAQLTGKLTTGIVALAERIICVRRLKTVAHRSTVAGDWEPTCTDTTLTRGEEAALARLRSGGFAQMRMAATATANRYPANAVGVRRGCRTGVVMHMVNGPWHYALPGAAEIYTSPVSRNGQGSRRTTPTT
ncbi:hypothetical protein TcYC6_0059800 [Trypanosoma cruzi]|nr:hypothetical protein TcYC6_0059800 [Trypanosoma cruzi]